MLNNKIHANDSVVIAEAAQRPRLHAMAGCQIGGTAAGFKDAAWFAAADA